MRRRGEGEGGRGEREGGGEGEGGGGIPLLFSQFSLLLFYSHPTLSLCLHPL